MFLLYSSECHFLFVVFCHSFHLSSDIAMFSLKSENIPFWSFSKRSQMLHSTHAGPCAEWGLPERMDDRKAWAWEQCRVHPKAVQEPEGLGQIHCLDFAAAFILSKCYSVSPAQGNRQHPHISHRLEIGTWLLKAHLCGSNLGLAMLNQCGSLCLQSGQKAGWWWRI